MNHTLIESVRTTLMQSGLSKSFWAEALANAVAVKNRIPRDDSKSAYESLTGKRPHIVLFKLFGCSSIVHLDERNVENICVKQRACYVVVKYGNG
jgi:hypothetical protein